MELTNSTTSFREQRLELKLIRTFFFPKLTCDDEMPGFNLLRFSRIQIQELQCICGMYRVTTWVLPSLNSSNLSIMFCWSKKSYFPWISFGMAPGESCKS